MGRIPKLEKEKALEEHRRELEQKSVDTHGIAGQLQNDVVAHPPGSVCEQRSPWPLEESSSPTHPNKPLVEMSKDKVIANRCPSIDSGIDDDVRDLSEKRKSLNRCWQNINETVEFGEAVSDSASEFNLGAGNDYLHQDRPRILRKRETSATTKFKNSGDSEWLGLNSNDAGISGRSNHSPSDCQSNQTHSMNLYSAYDTKSIEAVDIKHASGASSSCSSQNKMSMPVHKVLSVSPSHSGLPFYPTVIKELLNQVIETGHAKELQHNLVRQFLSASESADWRPEMLFQCLSNSQAGNSELAGGLGTCCLGSLDKSQAQTLKRKAPSDADEDDGDLGKGLKRIGQSLSHQSEATEEQVVDSSASSFQDISVVAAGCGSHNIETAQLLMKGIMKNEDQEITNVKKRQKSEPSEATGLSRGPVDGDVDARGSKKPNHFTAINSNSETVVKAADCIPGSECPARLQRMKMIEALASQVPQLTFWDIPENALGSLSATPPLAGTEMEQCKREIEQVLEWLNVAGHRFTEKTRLDLSVWDEEIAGLRPVSVTDVKDFAFASGLTLSV